MRITPTIVIAWLLLCQAACCPNSLPSAGAPSIEVLIADAPSYNVTAPSRLNGQTGDAVARFAGRLHLIRASNPDTLTLGVGDLMSSPQEISGVTARTYASLLGRMGWDALCPGVWGVGTLSQADPNDEASAGTPIVCGNASGAQEPGKAQFKPYFVKLAKSGVRVGITSLVGVTSDSPRTAPSVNPPLRAPGEALAQWVPAMRKECDVVLIVSDLGYAESRRLAGGVPGVDAIIDRGGGWPDARRSERFGGCTLLHQSDDRGGISKLSLAVTGKSGVAVKGFVSVDSASDVKSDERVALIMAQYRRDVEDRYQRILVAPQYGACSGESGATSVEQLCRRLSIEIPPAMKSELARISGEDITLDDLRKAVEGLGLAPAVKKLSPDELAALQAPAILQCWSGQFMLAIGSEGRATEYIDYSGASRQIGTPSDVFSGLALVFPRPGQTLADTVVSGPDIRLDRVCARFGAAREGDKVDRVFRIRNQGNADLRIGQVRATCAGCGSADVSKSLVPARGGAELKVSLDTAGRSGWQRQAFYLQSNDPKTPILNVSVCGWVWPRRLVMSTREVRFSKIREGETATRRVFIADPGDLEILGVVSDNPLVRASVERSTEPRLQGYIVRIELSPGGVGESQESKVSLSTNSQSEPLADIGVSIAYEQRVVSKSPGRKGTERPREQGAADSLTGHLTPATR